MNKRIPKAYPSLESAILSVSGRNTEIIKKDRIHGGDINDAYRISLSTGEKFFMKTNSIKNAGFFMTESLGLQALRETGTIGVPEILGTGIDKENGFSFLLLEYVESAPRIKTYWETFGHQLAELHKAKCLLPLSDYAHTEEACRSEVHDLQDARYGFPEDNFIGATPQKNHPKTKWINFYRECRLLPQIQMAESYFDSNIRKKFTYLCEHLDSYLREPDFPSLLHGDLWSGNVLCGNDGKAWILDPAAYIGDFEADLAMTQLFGSFPAVFYDAYNEINPVDKGYTARRNLYHLYQLLNHLNLFGRMYWGSVVEILNEYV